MRILRIAQKLYPDEKGGGAYHVHAMSRDQAAMGHDVTVVTVGEGPTIEERNSYTVIRCPSWGSLLGNDIAPGVGRHLLTIDAYDVVHAHSHLYFATNLAAVAGRLGETPLAITNHGLYSQNAPKGVFEAYLQTVGRWTFNAADVIFCYTEEDSNRVRDLGVQTDIEVVANGIDTSRFTPDGPMSELIEYNGLIILFVGRLVEGKRPEDAIDAVSRLPEKLDAKLYVVGDGPMHEDLAARGGDAVEFLGHVPYDEMPAVYRAGDVLILTSRAEGLPRTVLEAFASGVPVVSSHLEHTAPVVERGGETVPVGNVEGLSGALNQVLNERDVLGQRGREAAVEEFQWEGTVEETTARLEGLK